LTQKGFKFRWGLSNIYLDNSSHKTKRDEITSLICSVPKLKWYKECPYFLASVYQSYESGQDSYEIDNTGTCHVYQYDNPPLLIDNYLGVIFSEHPEAEISTYSYGICSFVDCLKAAGIIPYHLDVGSICRLNIKNLYWKPGSPKAEANERAGKKWFHDLGWWAIGRNDEIQNLNWVPLTKDVFAFNNSNEWRVLEIDWIFGTRADLPIDFLEEFYMAGFDPGSDDGDYNTRLEAYEESLNVIIRLLLENAISESADYRTQLANTADKTGQLPNCITQLAAEFNSGVLLVAARTGLEILAHQVFAHCLLRLVHGLQANPAIYQFDIEPCLPASTHLEQRTADQ